jgi:hypothetical protein
MKSLPGTTTSDLPVASIDSARADPFVAVKFWGYVPGLYNDIVAPPGV